MIKVYDFWAEWCGPCRAMIPTIESLIQKYNAAESNVEIIKVNVDKEPDLTTKYGIRSIPTMVFEKNGEVIETLAGAQPQAKIVSLIESLINE
jgi:thioredoxin 1